MCGYCKLLGPVHSKDIQCKSRSLQKGMHAPIETRSERNYAYYKCVLTNFLRAGVCRLCVERELTATKKSATDGNWSVTTPCRHKHVYDRIQLVADSC